ncbi:MAG: phage tail assembly chaperone [Sulfitobacter sp.]|nr:phage tail assembly chaperone [Sulfitobacter sp.]
MSGLAWGLLLRAGLRDLRMRPAEFWDLTPAELQLMVGREGAPAPLRAAGLEALMAAYPDDPKGECDD